MDLNARPTRNNFWHILQCCRNTQSNDDEENDENINPTKMSATDNYAFTPIKLFLNTKIMDAMSPSVADNNPETPSTVAVAGE